MGRIEAKASAVLIAAASCLVLLSACTDHARSAAEEAPAPRDATVDAQTEASQPHARDDAATVADGGSLRGDDARSPAELAAIAQGIEVLTAQGTVVGVTRGDTRAFLGIPYAKPPLGPLRFRAPEPPEPFTGGHQAVAFGPICAQALPVLGWPDNASEDCLTLNIWAPNPAPLKHLPVMVWLHGGAYQLGDGGGPYDGQKLSERGDVVVVSLNYRLGALGFLAHPALSEDAASGSGNYGIRDQQAALAWLRDNIAAFGGDPNELTLFGESAGGNSVCVHLVSPASRGLFKRAIVQSGLCLERIRSQEDGQALGSRFADALCGDAADVPSCLRALPARTITERSNVLGSTRPGGIMYDRAPNHYYFTPVVQPGVIPDQLERLFARGDFARVPVLHGANEAEGDLLQTGWVGGSPIYTEEQFAELLTPRFRALYDEVRALYAPPATADYRAALAAVTGDTLFYCPARRMAGYLSQHGVTSYLYRFAAPIESLLAPELSGRAIHSADIPYVFGNGFPLGSVPVDRAQLVGAVQDYWLHFAKTGDPNGAGGVPQGPRFRSFDDLGEQDEFVLDWPISVRARTRVDECALMARAAAPLLAAP